MSQLVASSNKSMRDRQIRQMIDDKNKDIAMYGDLSKYVNYIPQQKPVGPKRRRGRPRTKEVVYGVKRKVGRPKKVVLEPILIPNTVSTKMVIPANNKLKKLIIEKEIKGLDNEYNKCKDKQRKARQAIKLCTKEQKLITNEKAKLRRMKIKTGEHIVKSRIKK